MNLNSLNMCDLEYFKAKFRSFISFMLVGLLSFNAYTQQSKEELAQEAANPIADLMSFPFQNNLNMNYGPFNRNLNVLNIQPVIPFAEGRIITRTIFPIVSIPAERSEVRILLRPPYFNNSA